MNIISRQLMKIAEELSKQDQIRLFFEELGKGPKYGAMKKILQYWIRGEEDDAKKWLSKYLANQEDYDQIKQKIQYYIFNKISENKIEQYKKDNDLLQKFLDKNTSVVDYLIKLIEYYNKQTSTRSNTTNQKFYHYWTSRKDKIYIQTNDPNGLQKMSIFKQLEANSISIDDRKDSQKGITIYNFDFGSNDAGHKSHFEEMKKKIEHESKFEKISQ